MLTTDRITALSRRLSDTVHGLSATPRARQMGVAVAGAATVLMTGGAAASAATIANGVPEHPVAVAEHHAFENSSRKAAGKHPGTVEHGGGGAAHFVGAAPDPKPAALPAVPATQSAADSILPTATSGPQEYMQLTPAQQANAATIVHQAMAKKMGARSAVIAVATAMQESRLQNIGYGDADSLGLFQQRPSMGWGTEQQLLTPSYSADSFLTALQQQQAADPGWATQPLWSVAQSVQKSADPTAYAQWESQAAHLVQSITTPAKEVGMKVEHPAAPRGHGRGPTTGHHLASH